MGSWNNWNRRAWDLDLYDMVDGTAPHHLVVRNAIEAHRQDARHPVMFYSTNSRVTVQTESDRL